MACRNVQSRIVIWIYTAGTQPARHKWRTVGLSVCQDPECSLCSDPAHKLKLVLLHLPSTIFPPHDVPSVLIHLFFSTDSHALCFAAGKDQEKGHPYLGCANGSPIYLLPKSRGSLHSAHTCTHSSVLLDSKLECLTQVELHKGH